MADGNKSLAVREQSTAIDGRVVESIVMRGDISALSTEERARYYVQMCESLGLNPASQPLAALTLNGKQILYPTRGATDQLAATHRITREIVDGPRLMDLNGTKLVYAVCRATHPNGRQETATATVPFTDPVNVLMKCETKAKRRATLSILGLGMLDESEIETIPAAKKAPAPEVTQSQIATAQGTAANEPVDAEVETEEESPTETVLRALEGALAQDSAPTTTALVALLWLAFVPKFREAVAGDVDELAIVQERASGIVRDHLKKIAGHWSHYLAIVRECDETLLQALSVAESEIAAATNGDAVVGAIVSRRAALSQWPECARKYLREFGARRYQAVLKMPTIEGARTALGNALKAALAKSTPPDDGPRGGGAPAPSTPTNTTAVDDPERAAIESEGPLARDTDPFAYEQALVSNDDAWRKHLATKHNCYEIVSAYRKREHRFAACGVSRDRQRATIERISAIEGLTYDAAMHAFASHRWDHRTARKAA